MSDKKKHLKNLLKGAIFGILNFFVSVLIGLMLAPWVADTLGDRYYGIYILATAFTGTFALLDLGIDGAVSRYFVLHYAKGEKNECIALSNVAFFLYLGLGFIGFEYITVCAWGSYLSNPHMADRALLFLVIFIAAIDFGLSFPLKTFKGIISGSMRQELSGSNTLVFKLLRAGVTFLVLWFGGRVVALVLVGVSLTLLNIISLRRLARIAFPEFRIDIRFFRKDLLPKLFSFGLFTFLNSVGNAIRSKGNVFILAAMISLESITSFSLVTIGLTSHFFNLSETLCGSWLMNWLTYLHANENHELFEKTMVFSYKFCTYLCTFMAFGLIVWGYDFIECWAGAHRLDAYPGLVLITIGIWNNQCQMPNTKYLFATAKHHFIGYASIVGAVFHIVFSIVLIRNGFGVNGLALGAMITAILVRGTAIPCFVCHIRKENCFAYYLKIISYMTKAIIACIVPYIASTMLIAPTYPRLVLVGTVSALTYAPVIYWIGFTKSERRELWGIVSKKLFRPT